MILRHEINIINRSVANSSTGASNFTYEEQFLIDPSKYSGTLTYYLEVLYTNTRASTCDIYLGNSNLSSLKTVLSASQSTPALSRSQLTFSTFLSNPTIYNNMQMAANAAAGTTTLIAARIIILQNTGVIATSESQLEIGNGQLATTVTSVSVLQPLTAPKYWTYNSANWNGNVTFSAECTYLVSSTTGTKTIVIQEDNGSFASWTTVATILNAATGSITASRVRSSSFTPTNGRHYRLAFSNSSTMSTISIYNAKIIVDSVASTTDTIIGTTSPDVSGVIDKSVVIGVGQTFVPSVNASFIQINLYCSKIGSPTDAIICSLKTSISGTTLATTTVPSSNIGTTDAYVPFYIAYPLIANTQYFICFERTGVADTTNKYQTWRTNTDTYNTGLPPTDSDFYSNNGSGYQVLSGTDLTCTMFSSLVGVEQIEEHYLISNTTLAAGTALQTKLSLYDTTEWSGFTNTYKHQVDASASNTSVVELDTAAGSQLSGSVVTSPNNVGLSSAITMPASGNLDVKATTNSGNIFGSRIIVQVVKTVIQSIPNKIISFQQAVNRSNTY